MVARQGNGRQDKARQDKERQDNKERQDKARRQGKTKQGKTRQGKARQGKASRHQGKASQEKTMQGTNLKTNRHHQIPQCPLHPLHDRQSSVVYLQLRYYVVLKVIRVKVTIVSRLNKEKGKRFTLLIFVHGLEEESKVIEVSYFLNVHRSVPTVFKGLLEVMSCEVYIIFGIAFAKNSLKVFGFLYGRCRSLENIVTSQFVDTTNVFWCENFQKIIDCHFTRLRYIALVHFHLVEELH